jgi:hypothetical protein
LHVGTRSSPDWYRGGFIGSARASAAELGSPTGFCARRCVGLRSPVSRLASPRASARPGSAGRRGHGGLQSITAVERQPRSAKCVHQIVPEPFLRGNPSRRNHPEMAQGPPIRARLQFDGTAIRIRPQPSLPGLVSWGIDFSWTRTPPEEERAGPVGRSHW